MADRVQVSKYIKVEDGEIKYVPSEIIAGFQEGTLAIMAAYAETVQAIVQAAANGQRWACELIVNLNKDLVTIVAQAAGRGDPVDSWKTALKNAQNEKLEKALALASIQSAPSDYSTHPNGSSGPHAAANGSAPVSGSPACSKSAGSEGAPPSPA